MALNLLLQLLLLVPSGLVLIQQYGMYIVCHPDLDPGEEKRSPSPFFVLLLTSLGPLSFPLWVVVCLSVWQDVVCTDRDSPPSLIFIFLLISCRALPLVSSCFNLAMASIHPSIFQAPSISLDGCSCRKSMCLKL